MARRQMVEHYQSSGKSQREFCEDEGISLSTLQWWMRKTSGGAEPVAMALREVDWPAGPALTPASTWGLELGKTPYDSGPLFNFPQQQATRV